ncbi:hypothetical protein NQT62_01510 [Limnobacter humi]|uniref:Uncharacterized protein n=1 Tax=Limnobacter humi TaxID=1778671 RepID=A0ABT1WC72_9BURK|nr:hypothetical protein [Limnobacter humi]MCQ8895113.1 hypothetical protein [Limnobacter humi]
MMKKIICALALWPFAHAGLAAVTFEGNPSAIETPLGMNSVTDIDSTVASRRDANFNRVQVQSPGYGFAATAVGNLINVENSGSNNTVTIYATQINNGSQRASLSALGNSD